MVASRVSCRAARAMWMHQAVYSTDGISSRAGSGRVVADSEITVI